MTVHRTPDRLPQILDRAAEAITTAATRSRDYERRYREYLGGGFYSTSSDDKVHGTKDPPIPTADRIDARLAKDHRQLMHDARELDRLAAEVKKLIDRVVLVAPSQAEQENRPRICDNLHCQQDAPLGERTCSRCRKHRSLYSTDWPYLPDGRVVRTASGSVIAEM